MQKILKLLMKHRTRRWFFSQATPFSHWAADGVSFEIYGGSYDPLIVIKESCVFLGYSSVLNHPITSISLKFYEVWTKTIDKLEIKTQP